MSTQNSHPHEHPSEENCLRGGFSMEGLSSVHSTLLVPLKGRAKARRRFPEAPEDTVSEGLLARLGQNREQPTSQGEFDDLCYLVRAQRFDRIIRTFLQDHPEGTIIELGVGLDTGFWRISPSKAHWYAVDVPEVIALRKQILPSHPRLHEISGDLRDDSWLDQLDHVNTETSSEISPSPVLITACGVFHYLTQEQVRQLMCTLAHRIPGAQIAYDASSAHGLRQSQKALARAGHTAPMHYSVNHPAHEVSSWGIGARLISGTTFFADADLPAGLSFRTRAIITLVRLTRGASIIHAALPA